MSEGGGPVVTGAMLSSMQGHMGAGQGQAEGLVGNIAFKSFPSAFYGFSLPGGIVAVSGFDLGKMSPKAFSAQSHIGVAPNVGNGFEGGLFKGGQGGGQGMAA